MKVFIALAALLAAGAVPLGGQESVAPCCGVTAIDAPRGLVTARVTATGQTFTFRVTDRRSLATIKVGQAVFANFRTSMVSLDGRSSCCAITSSPSAASAAPPAPSTRTPAAPPAAAAPPARRVEEPTRPTAAAVRPEVMSTLPSIAYGPPRTLEVSTAARPELTRVSTSALTTRVNGRSVTGNVLHLRGLTAVTEAPGLPDGARRLLQMLVRRTPITESDQYIVNLDLAREWIAAHPVPDDVRPTEPAQKKCGNWYDSWDCAGQAVTDEWRRTYDHAVSEWTRAERKLAEAWDATATCFTERTLALNDIPVRFSIEPTMTVSLEESGSRGSATGTARGSVSLGVPMDADFKARLELFYIPCIPFAVRPKALSAEGSMAVAEVLTTTVTATGRFKRTFTIPPTGGPVIPIQVFPIIIGGVPVAELDVSAYIEGNIEVTADGAAAGRFQLRNSDRNQFEFSCSGSGCRAKSRGQPSPVTASEDVQVEGTVRVKPAIYTALQLNFNYEALSARAGPQPYLLGTASGCAAVAGTQTEGSGSTSQANHALTADLDWGLELRAEALVMRKVVGSPYVQQLMNDRHLWFGDMAPGGSSALVATATAAGPAVATQPASFRLRMPSCYPYREQVEYRVTWTGGAAPAPRAGCQWQAGRGTCKLNPARDEVIALTWPAAGSYQVTVAAAGDGHERRFGSANAPARIQVNVTP